MAKMTVRSALAIILSLQFPIATLGQMKDTEINLKHGRFHVGFRSYVQHDYTRTYTRLYDWDGKILPRPIAISQWYPAEKVRAESKLKVNDYMIILKDEEEWEHLPDNRILSWFYYPDNERNRKNLENETKAYRDAPAAMGKFPVVIYAPSYQASSVENFALCEFLASHGYVVISCPSRGTENRFLEGGTTRDIETQARDIEFLIGESSTMTNADSDKVSVIGFSFGGISNVLAQMRNDQIRALVCLDGSVKYQLPKLLSSSYADLSKVDVPFLFMSQKDIPLSVMIEDKIDTTLNRRFAFFDSLKHSQAYSLKFNHLTHPYFSSMGVLFQDRDLRQDRSEEEIRASYALAGDYTMHFLNAFLKGDASSMQFLGNDPAENGIPPELISINRKIPVAKSTSFEEFNLLARSKGYRELLPLVQALKREDAKLELPEWKLNNLGLQLLFRGKVQEGVNVLLLNTVLFPESANAFDSLAEGYLIQGNKTLAIRNFNLSLELDPRNQNAINRLRELGNR